eukprot:11184643-Lingulodinium_polyedra.AAC.1
MDDRRGVVEAGPANVRARGRDWLGRLESWCEAQLAGSKYLGLHYEFVWLQAAVHGWWPKC